MAAAAPVPQALSAPWRGSREGNRKNPDAPRAFGSRKPTFATRKPRPDNEAFREILAAIRASSVGIRFAGGHPEAIRIQRRGAV